MPIEGIKMSLIHSLPPPHPLMSLTFGDSLLKLGWWPSATKDTKANKSSSFQHLPRPKGLPTRPPHHTIPCEDGSLALFLFSPSVYSPQRTPPPRLTKHLFSHVQVKKRPSFPLFDKGRLKPRWGLPAKMPGTRQGCPPLPPLHFPPALGFILPLLLLSFLLLVLPSCGGHSLSVPSPL